MLAAGEDGLRKMGELQLEGPPLARREEARVLLRRAITEQNVLITSVMVAMELGLEKARGVFDKAEAYDAAGLSDEQSRALKKAREEKEKIKAEQQQSQQQWGYGGGRGRGRGGYRSQPYYYQQQVPVAAQQIPAYYAAQAPIVQQPMTMGAANAGQWAPPGSMMFVPQYRQQVGRKGDSICYRCGQRGHFGKDGLCVPGAQEAYAAAKQQQVASSAAGGPVDLSIPALTYVQQGPPGTG